MYKKSLFFVLLLFTGIFLLYSMVDETSLEVVSVTYVDKMNHDAFISAGNSLRSDMENDLKSHRIRVRPLSKLSNSTWKKINTKLSDYNCSAGDVFAIQMSPWGNRLSDEGYIMIVRFTSSTEYEWSSNSKFEKFMAQKYSTIVLIEIFFVFLYQISTFV